MNDGTNESGLVMWRVYQRTRRLHAVLPDARKSACGWYAAESLGRGETWYPPRGTECGSCVNAVRREEARRAQAGQPPISSFAPAGRIPRLELHVEVRGEGGDGAAFDGDSFVLWVDACEDDFLMVPENRYHGMRAHRQARQEAIARTLSGVED